MTLRPFSFAMSLILVAVVGVGCAPQGGGGGTKPLGSFKKRVSATIFLVGPDAANCKAKVSPYTLQPKNNEWADWTVIDLCGITNSYAELVKLTFTPGDASYCDGEPPFAGNVEGKMNFFAAVNNKCKPEQKFSYTVSVGNGAPLADPELEIAQ